MKKSYFILVSVLVALLMTAWSGNAEKLRHEDNDWDSQWYFSYVPDLPDADGVFTLKINFLLHRGIAKASQKSGKFSIQISATAPDGHTWQTIKSVTLNNNDWDRRQKYIPITGVLEWNGDDDGSQTISRLSITLLGPHGKALGPTLIEDTGELLIYGPEFPGVPPGCGDEFPCPGAP